MARRRRREPRRSVEIRLPYQWTPRPYQRRVWDYLGAGGKRAVVCWPRRHGKDDVGLHHTACAMAERKGTYWYLLPEYAQARKSVWDAVDEERGVRRIDLAFPPALVKTGVYKDHEMMLGFYGSTFQLVGADNYNSLVGSPPVGVVFSEYARTDPSAWAYIMPIIEKNRGWAYFNSTPYGDNHFKTFTDYATKKMAEGKDWFFERLTAEQCGVYTRAQLQAIEEELCETHGEDYGRALFLQEYYTSFDAAIPGSIWGDCLDHAKAQGRLHPFAIDRTKKVYTGWDIGRDDDTAIWFYQLIGSELFVFDYHSSSLKDIDFYVELLEQKRDEYGLIYGRHWLPHDARPRTLASGAGSMLQQMLEHARRNPKLGTFALLTNLDRQEGIQAARKTFQVCHFHDTRCEKGLKALRHYHREWDAEKKVFTTEPYHDWASHGADAFRTVALTWKIEREALPEAQLTDRLLMGNPVKQTFGQMVAAHFTKRQRAREAWR